MSRFVFPVLLLLTGMAEARLQLFRVESRNAKNAGLMRLGQPSVDNFEFLIKEESRSALRYLSGGFDGSMSMLDFSLSMATSSPSKAPTFIPSIRAASQAPSTSPVATTAPPSTPATNSPTVGSTTQPTGLVPDALSNDTVSATTSPTASPTAIDDGAAAIKGPATADGGSSNDRQRSAMVATLVLVAAGSVLGLAFLLLRRRNRTGGSVSFGSEEDSSV